MYAKKIQVTSEWDILWYTTRKPCITVWYHVIENMWHYIIGVVHDGKVGVIPLNCTDRWKGLVQYRQLYNSFPAFRLAVFAMAWYKMHYTANTCNVYNNCTATPSIENYPLRKRKIEVPTHFSLPPSEKRTILLKDQQSRLVYPLGT